jgi:hypothetical protein
MQQKLLPSGVPTTNPREFLARANVFRELGMRSGNVQPRGIAQK